MRIDRIELFHVGMPLIYPWRTAYGEDAAIHSVLCRMSSGSIDGWGESAPFAAPCYSSEWAGGAFSVARQWLAPALIGQTIVSGGQLQQRLEMFKGNPFAKAVLDNAWWSLHSRRAGTPLHELLAGQSAGQSSDLRLLAPVGADFGVMDSIDDLLDHVRQAVQDGFPRLKLKFRPGWDLRMLAAVRKQHPTHPIHIDCNSGYSLRDASLFQQIDQHQLTMIEQPLAHDDLVDHAALARQIQTPICLDESIGHLRAAQQAISLSSCRYVNIKPGRVGGLTVAVAIHDACRAAGVPCWVGGMLESAVGASHCVALAMLDNFTYPADIFPSQRFYHQDLADPPLELSRDPSNSGAGVPCVRPFDVLPQPNPDRLKKLTIQNAVVE